MPRLGKGLAAAIGLAAAAAVPTVVALSEDPQAGPSGNRSAAPWPAGAAGDSTTAAAAAPACAHTCAAVAEASAASWSLSRVLEEFLGRARQLAAAGDLGDGSYEDVGDEEEADGTAAAAAAAADHLAATAASSSGFSGSGAGAAAEAAIIPLKQQQQQQLALGGDAAAASSSRRLHGRQPPPPQQQRRARRALDVSPVRLAAEHPDEVATMRQLALAELARLQANSAGQQQQQQAEAEQTEGEAAAAAARVAGSQGEAAPAICQGAELAAAAAAELPPGFTDAELMRYALMYGLLRATSIQQRQAALQEGAAAAARTAVWLREHLFSTDEELRRFAHLVSWEGTDAGGHPILRVAIGKAVSECRGAAALAFANAVITHVERGVARRMEHTTLSSSSGSSGISGVSGSGVSGSGVSGSGTQPGCSSSGGGSPAHHSSSTGGGPAASGGSPGGGKGANMAADAAPAEPTAAAAAADAAAAAAAGDAVAGAATAAATGPGPLLPPDRVVVVMDCTGASTLNAARISWVFKAVASTLAHHYPGRLHELVLLELPVMLGWIVKGVKQLVHPDTRHKFRVVRQHDK